MNHVCVYLQYNYTNGVLFKGVFFSKILEVSMECIMHYHVFSIGNSCAWNCYI